MAAGPPTERITLIRAGWAAVWDITPFNHYHVISLGSSRKFLYEATPKSDLGWHSGPLAEACIKHFCVGSKLSVLNSTVVYLSYTGRVSWTGNLILGKILIRSGSMSISKAHKSPLSLSLKTSSDPNFVHKSKIRYQLFITPLLYFISNLKGQFKSCLWSCKSNSRKKCSPPAICLGTKQPYHHRSPHPHIICLLVQVTLLWMSRISPLMLI